MKVFKKKKEFASTAVRSIAKVYTFADISPNIFMPISKFLQQLIILTTKNCYLTTTVKALCTVNMFPTNFLVKMLNI